MSFIVLNDETERQFKKYFLQPINKLQESGKIDSPTDDIKSDIYRKKWLQQGRRDFDGSIPNNCKLNASELVDLYCYYYFQMHYSSSKLVFDNGTETLKEVCNTKNSVHFFDFGCGPITVGIAFNHWMKENLGTQKNVYYYGLGSSKKMRNKATELLKEKNFSHEYLDTNIFEPRQEKLINHLNNYIEVQSSKQIILINFCYLFASYTLNVHKLKKEIETIIAILTTKKHIPKVIVIYQNPKGYREKWVEFKNKMTTFKSVEDYPKTHGFSYRSVTQSNRRFNFNVAVDIIKNY